MMSTGSMSAPLMEDTSPRCRIPGSRFVVTRMGKGSISEAHTGVIPASRPPRGKPPEPSNRLPSFNLSTGADLFDQVYVGDAFPVPEDVDAAGVPGTLRIAPEDDRCVLLV